MQPLPDYPKEQDATVDEEKVCAYCGSELTQREIVGMIGKQSVCMPCRKIEYGVEKHIYLWAKEYQAKYNFAYYHDISNPEEGAKSNTSKLCGIAKAFLQHYRITKR